MAIFDQNCKAFHKNPQKKPASRQRCTNAASCCQCSTNPFPGLGWLVAQASVGLSSGQSGKKYHGFLDCF